VDTSGLRNIAMVVEYDGTDFHGFQCQPRHRSVQAELEKAIWRITGEETRIHGAGRTDAGVHAVGQVINVHLATKLPIADLARAVNAVLPPDVSVRDPREMESGFDARHSALARTYRYTVWNTAARSPTLARYTWHWNGNLDDAAIREGLSYLVGTRDFASFSGPIATAREDRADGRSTTIRQVEEIDWRRRGSLVTMEITASGFLPHMVRNIMGAAIRIGSGRMGSADVARLLGARDRRLAPPPAPASGLCLVRVRYDLSPSAGDGDGLAGSAWPGDNAMPLDYNVHSGLHSEAGGPIPDLIR
jgi:tRNA pseudouridine38-40 synthase